MIKDIKTGKDVDNDVKKVGVEDTQDKIQEHLQEMQDEYEAYKKEIDALNTEEELEKKEEELMAEMDKNKEYIDKASYDLPNEVTFDGKIYKKTDVCGFLLNMLNKLEVQWSLTLGYYQLYNFWKSDQKQVSYGILDSTLRTLQQLKFKGYTDWKSILIINEYFKFNHDEYTKDLASTMLLAQKHNCILDRMKLIAKTVDPTSAIIEDGMKTVESENVKNI